MYPLNQADCDRCDLRAGCSRVVWGGGNPDARILFLGDNPGPEEDLMGAPFKGREGRLLVRLIERAGIDPEECYFTYAVKCTPGRGTKPTAEHTNACREWLWQELKKCNPAVVVTLGNGPTRLLLGLKKSFKMASVVGVFHAVKFMGGVVAPWYAPSHVLQHGKAADREAVEFLKTVQEKVEHAGHRNG